MCHLGDYFPFGVTEPIVLVESKEMSIGNPKALTSRQSFGQKSRKAVMIKLAFVRYDHNRGAWNGLSTQFFTVLPWPVHL